MGIVGSAIGAVGSIFGGISASRAMKKAKNRTEQLRTDNQNWYDRRYNEDDTQRADAQAMLTQVRDDIRNRNRQSAGTQAVMGGTQESTAAAKAANNEALANTASNIAASAANRKDSIEQQYMQNEASYVKQLNDLDVNRANATAEATKGLTAAVNEAEAANWGRDTGTTADTGNTITLKVEKS